MILLYTLALSLYTFLIYIVALLGHQKAKAWVKGRKNIFHQLEQSFRHNQAPVIWVHCASLGEFEQGRPLIEVLKVAAPQYKILLTFFSPSGYQIQQNYSQADWVFYLPADSPSNARQFISIVQPQQVIFVKYEFWYHYLTQLQTKQIPTYLISAIFRPNQLFFKWYGSLFRSMLYCFQAIFVQNQQSLELLQQTGYTKAVLAGDTRLDRVLNIKHQAKQFKSIEQFVAGQFTMIAGSTWPADEAVLAAAQQEYSIKKLIIAPHQVDAQHIQQTEQLFSGKKCLRYSQQPTAQQLQEATVLIIDNIGMLSSIYAYANIAYIGGGFGTGIHNSLEAVVFEIPVLFGPKHQKFKEAKDLLELGIAFEVNHAQELIQHLQQLQDPAKVNKIQQKAKQYFQQHSGATSIILSHLLSKA